MPEFVISNRGTGYIHKYTDKPLCIHLNVSSLNCEIGYIHKYTDKPLCIYLNISSIAEFNFICWRMCYFCNYGIFIIYFIS